MRPSTPSPPYLPPAERRAAPCRAAGGTSNLLPCPIVYSGNFTSVDIPCGAIPAVLRDTPQPAPSTGGSAVWFVSAGADVCAKFGSFAPFSDYWYLVQPVWLVYFFFNLALFVGCTSRCAAGDTSTRPFCRRRHRRRRHRVLRCHRLHVPLRIHHRLRL